MVVLRARALLTASSLAQPLTPHPPDPAPTPAAGRRAPAGGLQFRRRPPLRESTRLAQRVGGAHLLHGLGHTGVEPLHTELLSPPHPALLALLVIFIERPRPASLELFFLFIVLKKKPIFYSVLEGSLGFRL